MASRNFKNLLFYYAGGGIVIGVETETLCIQQILVNEKMDMMFFVVDKTER